MKVYLIINAQVTCIIIMPKIKCSLQLLSLALSTILITGPMQAVALVFAAVACLALGSHFCLFNVGP